MKQVCLQFNSPRYSCVESAVLINGRFLLSMKVKSDVGSHGQLTVMKSLDLNNLLYLQMSVSLSVFSIFSAPALSLTMPQALPSAAAFLQTNSITWNLLRVPPNEGAGRTHWRDVFSYHSQISGFCLGFPLRNEKNRNWCLQLNSNPA